MLVCCSNNTNKLSPQEHLDNSFESQYGSNNTNKLSPQEHSERAATPFVVQIIQINLVLKNSMTTGVAPFLFK